MLRLEVTAHTYHKFGVSTSRCNHRDTYTYRGSNRKAAITWALNKIERAFPDHKSYGATILESEQETYAPTELSADTCAMPSYT